MKIKMILLAILLLITLSGCKNKAATPPTFLIQDYVTETVYSSPYLAVPQSYFIQEYKGKVALTKEQIKNLKLKALDVEEIDFTGIMDLYIIKNPNVWLIENTDEKAIPEIIVISEDGRMFYDTLTINENKKQSFLLRQIKPLLKEKDYVVEKVVYFPDDKKEEDFINEINDVKLTVEEIQNSRLEEVNIKEVMEDNFGKASGKNNWNIQKSYRAYFVYDNDQPSKLLLYMSYSDYNNALLIGNLVPSNDDKYSCDVFFKIK